MDDDNLFGAPPSDDFFGAAPEDTTQLPPAAEDAGFTLLGEAEVSGNAAYVGDVQDVAATDGGDDAMGFAAAPTGGDDGLGFAAAPTGGDDAMGFAFMGSDQAPLPTGDETAEDNMGFADAPPADDNIVECLQPIILGGEPGAPGGGDDRDLIVDDASEDAEERKEPSAMAKYNLEFQETLVTRKEEEEDAKVAMTEEARVYMEEFQAKREAKRDSKMATNREDEQAKLEAIEADLENDNSWQRVSNTVELTQDSADDGQDTQRMRDIFILLKNEPGLAAKVGA